MNNIDFAKHTELARKFRLAIVMHDHDVIADMGMLSFYDDVLQTRLIDIVEPTLQPTRLLILGMVDVLMRHNNEFQEGISGLALATFNKLESLVWKNYQKLVRQANRNGSEMRAKHFKKN
jgi:chemotaxis methyl-accepting protein methylase